MDFNGFNQARPLARLVNRVLLFLLLVPATTWGGLQDWQKDLSSSGPGAFPLPREQIAIYHFGWSRFIHAGEAAATFTKPKPDILQLDVKGGSIGLVRDLWRLDASHKAVARASTLRPLRIKQTEVYASKTVSTSLTFNAHGVSSMRTVTPPDPVPPKVQKFTFPSVYDLQTALIYFRSQRLLPGDRLSLVVYPANTPYLVTIRVIGREQIQVKAGNYSALKLELYLQRINNQLGLEAHNKFKRAFAWISDDSNRSLLRVEAEIFVGSVWAELQSVKFTGR